MTLAPSKFRPLVLAATVAACGAEGGSGPGGADGGGDGTPLEVARERSLVWTDPSIVDDPSIVGLGRVMAAIADDGHGGALLRDMFVAFSTTAHSERLGPALMIQELETELGADASNWNLDQLPFLVTAVHNRIDLGPRNGGCGELRVSLASTHPLYAPFHLLFLFRQEPTDGDMDGADVHCRATARRWAGLTELDPGAFAAEADAILTETLRRDRFLLAESVELTVSPWEWRQWTGTTNPPLFQTVDSERLNQPGPLRDEFLAFARDNAQGLLDRTVEIPERFRPRSTRVPPGVERARLDLPDDMPGGLADAIEIVGCPACHTTDAEFVQTTPQRTFSPFYDAELDARADRLGRQAGGLEMPMPPFGPLQ